MFRKTFALFLFVIAFVVVHTQSASAQIYVLSHVDVLSDGSAVEGECETLGKDDYAEQGRTTLTYYQFGTICSMATPNGTSMCSQNNGDEVQGNPDADCSWTVPVTPGWSYQINSEHKVWLWTDGEFTGGPPPYTCDGTTGWYQPCGPPYEDYGHFSEFGTQGGPAWTGYLIFDPTLQVKFTIGTTLPPIGNPSFEVAETNADFTSISLSPKNLSMFEKQGVNFATNADDLQATAGSQQDAINWCIHAEASCSSITIGQGYFTNDPVWAYATYYAPDSVTGSQDFGTWSVPSSATFVCAQEAINDSNMTCAQISLTQLKLDLLPLNPTLSPGQAQTLTAYVNTTAYTVSWGPWQLSPLTQVGSPGQQKTVGQSSANTFNFISNQAVTESVTETATVNLNSSDGTLTGPTAEPLQGSTTVTVSSSLKSQSITFGSISSQVVNIPLSLSAKASSRLALTYLTMTPTVCTVSGSTASFLATGTCTIEADQTGNSTYAAAPSVTQTFSVRGAAQTITFASISSQVLNISVPLSATASSGLPVSFSSTTLTVCQVSGASTAVTVGTGTCTIQANQAGNAIYGAAATVSRSFSVTTGVAQTISFAAIASPQLAGTSVALSATATSGLPVTFASASPATCFVAGTTATTSGAGNCTVQAMQPGSTTYQSAPTVSQTFAVSLVNQSITFNVSATGYLNTIVGLGATTTSGLPVSYVSLTPSTCSVVQSSATLLAAGTCTIKADQGGNNIYAPAASVTQSFAVAANAQTAADASFAATAIGSTSTPNVISFMFTNSTTLGATSILTEGIAGGDFADTGGGTCTVGSSYNAGDTCSIAISFSPNLAGARYGAAELYDSSGNPIATGYLQGIGTGSEISFVPGNQWTRASGFSGVVGVAVDGSANLYVVDENAGQIYKESLQGNGTYVQSQLPTSTLARPQGIAVDSTGAVYIADTNNNRILKETPASGGGYVESILPTSSLNQPEAVAVDGLGNVYIADSNNFRVLREIFEGGNYSESVVLYSPPSDGTIFPSGVAVDGNGVVYVSDVVNQQHVWMLTPSSSGYTKRSISLGSARAAQVAADRFGNFYVIDQLNSLVEKVTSTNGTSSITPISATLRSPLGIAADGRGNLYIADTGNARIVEEDLADPPNLTFAPTPVGATSSDSPEVITVENVGNSSLSFPVPGSGSNPSISSGFSLGNSGASPCPVVASSASQGALLGSGQSCTLAISFSPSVAGSISGTLVVTDDSGKASGSGYATQTTQLNGYGQQLQTITFTSPPASIKNGSQITLVASASSGLPVTFTVSGPATVSGNILTATAVGTVVVTANQPGNTTFAPAAPVSYTITVTR